MIVLDASAVLELVLNTEAGRQVLERIEDPAESLHAPHLMGVEVAQVLRRYVRAHQVAEETAASALSDLLDLDVARYEHEPLLPRVWQLRDNVTAYDGVYLALAEVLDAPLLTRDRRLAGSSGHDAVVELVAGRAH
ncbi:MAG: type II toxin-antitoxin system VapC family toxin [Actinomycetota bacterium]|nr:type II toxin-antitoxin system VapC family toxin [Actinomycetota bacterium]